MKIVIIGGSGFIGAKLVKELRELRHQVVAASSDYAANTVNFQNLIQLLKDTQVVIDVANASSSEDNEILKFYKSSGHNLLEAEAIAGVNHHIILSAVGLEQLQGNGFFRAKKVQENLVKGSAIPYTILQATQFFEMVRGIAQAATTEGEIHISNAAVQPVASDEVASVITEISVGAPLNITLQVAGPDRLQLNELIQIFLNETQDSRRIVMDDKALYAGVKIAKHSLLPKDNARLGKIRFIDWLRKQDKSFPNDLKNIKT